MALSIVKEPYAWPGGYERLLITEDGGLLCSACVKKELFNIMWDIQNNANTGWLPGGTRYEAGSLAWCLDGRQARIQREMWGVLTYDKTEDDDGSLAERQRELEEREDLISYCDCCCKEFGELS